MPDYGPKNFNCLAGCVRNYAVGHVQHEAPYLRGIEAENFAPIIIATILRRNQQTFDQQKFITVGNESYPFNPNKAVIKSIEFGYIDDNTGRMEVIDEEGGSLSLFLDSIIKCGSGEGIGVGSTMLYRIGWCYTTCSGQSNSELGPPLESFITSIDSSLSNGIIKYSINFETKANRVQLNRHDAIFGEEVGGKEMTLEQAISTLCAIPPTLQVRYARRNEKGNLIYVDKHKWVGGDKKAAWRADNQNKYSTIMKWLEPFRIDDGPNPKGVVLLQDPAKPDVLVVMEDPQASCDEKIDIDKNSVVASHFGTFIINGGKCSNVLEFNPTINFNNAFANMSSGGSTDTSSTKSNLKEEERAARISCKDYENSKQIGTQSQSSTTGEAHRIYGNNAGQEANISAETHIKANVLISLSSSPINAELRIVGNVHERYYGLVAGSSCSIIMINPNHIEKSTNNCGDFLKRASCHPFFSNKQWMIMGVNHRIQEGSFVTTLKIKLNAPGANLSGTNTLGANDSGIRIKNTCVT